MHGDVDRDRCEGHGLCEQTAAEIFRLDDDGELEIRVEEIPPDLRAKAAGMGLSLLPISVTAMRREGVVAMPLEEPAPTIPRCALWHAEVRTARSPCRFNV